MELDLGEGWGISDQRNEIRTSRSNAHKEVWGTTERRLI